MPRIQQWLVATEKWTSDKPLRIALIADTHAIWPWMTPRHLRRIVAETNALNPDIILMLGDYVATHPFGMQLRSDECLQPFTKLAAPCGVYAVLGNHDFDRPDDGWPQALRDTGIPVLENRAHYIDAAGHKFWIAGLEDLWKQKPDIHGTLSQIDTEHPVIVMMHNPDSFPDIPHRVTLSVAGHTHGGQIRFPFYGAVPAVIPSRYGMRYVYGHVNEEGKDMVVTSGLGMTGVPVRFMTPPEIAVITVQSP